MTRARIQDVALALFATRGYDATSRQQIATALAVTKAALHYRVPFKAALLHSLVGPFLDAERTLIVGYGARPLDTTARPLDTTARREVLRALIDLLLAYRPIVARLTRDLAALAQPGIGARVAENADRLQRLLVGAGTDGAGQVRAAAAVGALTRPFAVLPELDLGALRDTVAAATLGALGAEEGAACYRHRSPAPAG